MDPIALLLLGMAIVIGGILCFRLHAFLALIIAALAVAGLTREENISQFHLDMVGIRVSPLEDTPDTVDLRPGSKQTFIPGRSVFLRPDARGLFREIGRGQLDRAGADDPGKPGAYAITGKDRAFSLRAGDRVAHETHFSAAMSAARKNMGERVAAGFGKTCTSIGILIAMAAIIGKCLMDSGAAERIVLGMRNALGEKRAPLAFIGSGFTLGIPVFFDTVFYLMIPLGKAMRVRTGKNYLLYVLCIVAGGTMAHSLVPPTPGPLFVAGELDVDIGLMMLAGTLVGLFTAGSGYLYALWANRRWDIPLRESAELPREQLEAMANRDESQLPGLFFSILPILIPVVLMAGGTILDMSLNAAATPPQWLLDLKPTYKLLGNKNIAMTIAALCSLVLLARAQKASKEQIADAIQSALASGGVIILITAAGGAFGGALRESGIAATIQQMMPETQVGLLPLAFFVTLVVRTAQGSATVAMITAVGIISPILATQDLSYNPLWIALAIGCGSKPISWMNDSGFWVISRMSGLSEGEMLKTNTVMGCIMASVGLGICILGATVLPLA